MLLLPRGVFFLGAAFSASVFFVFAPCAALDAFGASLHTSKQQRKRRSGPSASGVEALLPPLQPLPALRCLKLSLKAEAPQRIRF